MSDELDLVAALVRLENYAEHVQHVTGMGDVLHGVMLGRGSSELRRSDILTVLEAGWRYVDICR